jgi:hypothetical protein
LVNVAIELVDCHALLFPSVGKKKAKSAEVPVADVMVDILLSLMSRYPSPPFPAVFVMR